MAPDETSGGEGCWVGSAGSVMRWLGSAAPFQRVLAAAASSSSNAAAVDWTPASAAGDGGPATGAAGLFPHHDAQHACHSLCCSDCVSSSAGVKDMTYVCPDSGQLAPRTTRCAGLALLWPVGSEASAARSDQCANGRDGYEHASLSCMCQVLVSPDCSPQQAPRVTDSRKRVCDAMAQIH